MIKNWIDRLSERERWQLHLFIITIPVLLGMSASIGRSSYLEPGPNLYFLGYELRQLVIFGGFFTLAFLISGVIAAELSLRPARFWRVLLNGLGLGAVVALLAEGGLRLFDRWHGVSLGIGTLNTLEYVALVGHPVAFAFRYGLDSCVAGGLDELYRAALFAALFVLYPGLSRGRLGGVAVLVLGALILAISHYYQGLHGMIPTFFLGILFGGILLYRNSLAEAAIAHAVVKMVFCTVAYYAVATAPPPSNNVAGCAWRGNLQAVRELVAKGGNVNERTATKVTGWEDMPALEAAVLSKGNGDELVAFLLAHGAEVDARDPHGRTALLTAAVYGHLEQARLLLAHGADPTIAEENGYTPLTAARMRGHGATADLIAARLKDLRVR